MVCPVMSTSAISSSWAGKSRSCPSSADTSNRVLTVLSSTDRRVPTLWPVAWSMTVKPTMALHVTTPSPPSAWTRGKNTSHPVSSRADSCVSMSQNFTMAVLSDRKRYSSMKNGTSMPSISSTRYSASVRSNTSSSNMKLTSPDTPCGLPIFPILYTSSRRIISTSPF